MRSYIDSNKKVRDAPEQVLPAIFGSQMYQRREQVARPLLARIIQKRQAKGD